MAYYSIHNGAVSFVASFAPKTEDVSRKCIFFNCLCFVSLLWKRFPLRRESVALGRGRMIPRDERLPLRDKPLALLRECLPPQSGIPFLRRH